MLRQRSEVFKRERQGRFGPLTVDPNDTEFLSLLHSLIEFVLAGDADGAALVARWAAGECRRTAA